MKRLIIPLQARAQLIAIALLAIGLAILIWFGFQTYTALCTFRGDLNRRADVLETYIADVKAGRKKIIEGFTVTELERNLSNQRQALDSLDILWCGSGAPIARAPSRRSSPREHV